MIGLVDPAFLLPRSQPGADQEVLADLDFILGLCSRRQVTLVPFEEYWPEMWRTLGRNLERSLADPLAKRALAELKRLGGRPTASQPVVAADGRAWRRGFAQLFGWQPLGAGWEERMARAALRAVASGQKVLLLVRRAPARNLIVHAAGGSTIEENTRCQLYLQPRGRGPTALPCVYHARNLAVPWTTRFDWRLPAVGDGARYPFCAPARWWSYRLTQAVRTVASKPAWLDAQGNGWARPSMPGGRGYHWDVFLCPAQAARIGVGQINVVEYGAPRTEGVAGCLHHVPGNKQQRVRDCGWTCP